MTVTIRASCSPGEIRIAACDAAGLLDYALWRPGSPDGVGDIHRARITAMTPSMAGAFVALADTSDTTSGGFLPDSAGATGRTVGDILAVRITRAAQGGKGPRVAATPDDPGHGPPALLRPGPNPLLRLAALHPGPVFLDDLAIAATLRPALGDRLHIATDAWDDTLHAAADALATPLALLPGGLRAHIEPTHALVAIDLDMAEATTAHTISGRQPKPAQQEAANRAALPALARHIRLRNLSGTILIDFAGMAQRRRPALAAALAEALAPDPLRPRLLGFTPGGLAEILRPRIHPPLHELLRGPHAAGLLALRQLAADPLNPRTLVATPDIVSALQADPAALAALAHRLGRALVMRSDPALPPGRWTLEDPARGEYPRV